MELGEENEVRMQMALVLLSILALVLIARTEPHDVYEIVDRRGDPSRRDL